LALFCFTPLLLAGLSSVAQSPVSRPLIVEKVNENQLVTLKGNTPPAASAENDRGRVSPSLPMTGMILVLRRSPEQQAAFDAFVASQYDVTSPNFHRWLDPAEIGEKFGPALADIATVSSWLAGHGLSVDEVSKDRMTIRFSGSAAQVQEAFHTEIHNLLVKGVPHISNMSDPQIPMALEPVVLGPKALHNFIPRPLHRIGAAVKINRETGKWERISDDSANQNKVRADIGFIGGSGSNTYPIEDVAPYDFATIYNVLPLWNASTPIDGTGQTIAIAGRSDVRAADVAKFRSTFGLTGGAFNQINNGADPGYCTSTLSTALCTLDDQIENALDVEWAGAVAKGATIDLVVTAQTLANDAIFDSAQYVVNNKTASIINVSYGQCELFLGTSGNSAYNNLWESASTGGIAVFVATGDSGSPSCDQGGDSAGTPYSAIYGLTVSGMASTAFNTAVGGTDLNWGSTASPYWNATNNSTNGSTARGYIPETPWNDSCTNPLLLSYVQSIATFLNKNGVSVPNPTNAESSCNLIQNYWTQAKALAGIDVSSLVDTVGGSGGASNCTSGDGSTIASCTGGYAKPSWQGGVTGIPNDNKRDIPDVSFFAGNGLLGSAYVVCVSDIGTACLASATSTTEPAGQEIGGTSVASPAMAGVMALINQKAGSAQGNPNSELYILAGQQTYSSCSAETVVATSGSCYFNDIDTGTNAMPCASGSPACTVSTSGDPVGVLSGFSGATGYDEASGLGSLNVTNVVNGFAAVSTGTAIATVGVSASPSSFTSAQGTSVTVTVTGASSTPTGTVQLSTGAFISASKSLSGGSVTFTLSPGVLAVGTDTVRASYSGDATYAAAAGTTTVTVTQAVYITPTVTVTPASNSIDTGQTLNVAVAVTGAGPQPTGTVTLSGGGYTASAQKLVAGNYTFAIPANSLSVGTDTLTVSYSGDGSYASGVGSATVTVTASAFALSSASPAAISPGGSATSTITATSSTAYSGTITLTCALTTSPAGASNVPTCSTSGGATITMAAGTASGSGSVTVATTAATSAMKRPPVGGWAEAGSGAVLALLVFFGIPARRRGWRAMLGAFVLLASLGSLTACGGGSSSSNGGGGNPGTTAGSYVFTVTGTGSDPAKTVQTTTFTVVVN
jgi:hypothetical protein